MSHDEYLGMRRFPGLDGLRAIAATIVVFFHFAGPKWSWLSGWVGVYVFFVLSGFLITTLLLREQDRTGRISLGDFYLRRVFRILPPYLVILGGIIAFVLLRGEFFARDFPHALKYYLTFLNEFFPASGGNGSDNFFSGSWTLGIEEKFYLVWPFLLVAIGIGAARRKVALALGAMIVLLALVPVTTNGWLLDFTPSVYRSSIHYFILLSGCLLAIVLHHRRSFALLGPLTHPVAGLAIVAGFLVLHTNLDSLWTETRQNLLLLVAYAGATMLLLVVLVSPGPARRLLATRPMRFVGERSYSLYLLQGPVHFAVIQAVPSLAQNRLVSAVTVFMVALAIADLIHRWVEQPMIATGKRLISWRHARKNAKAAQPAVAEEPRIEATVG